MGAEHLDFLFEYGLFLAEVVTILVAILVLVDVVVGLSQRSRQDDSGHIEVKSVNDSLDNLTSNIKHLVLNPEARKQQGKDDKKRHKEEQKEQKKIAKEGGEGKGRVFVVDFVGDVQASAVSALREEVTAILSVAKKEDEVVVRLESQGGTVHGYGLAASQLKRIVSRDIALTVSRRLDDGLYWNPDNRRTFRYSWLHWCGCPAPQLPSFSEGQGGRCGGADGR